MQGKWHKTLTMVTQQDSKREIEKGCGGGGGGGGGSGFLWALSGACQTKPIHFVAVGSPPSSIPATHS